MATVRERVACAFFVVVLGCAQATAGNPADISDLQRAFERPPDDARIMMRWWWFGPAVTKAELEREMRQMKEGGIGGFEIQPVYPLALDDPQNGFRNLPYLSDEFIDALRFVSEKARELGLRVDLTLGSGWPYGGPSVPITQAAGKLRIERVAVPSGTHSLAMPSIEAGESFLAAFLAPGDPKSFSGEDFLELRDVEHGRLLLPPLASGSHVALFFISSRTGMMVKRPAVGAEGFVVDHYDRDAVENYLRAVGDRLMQAFGAHPPYAIFSDSLEVYGSDWTGNLLEEFPKRRGYDLRPYLPALALHHDGAGLAGGTGEKTAAVRHDWGKTLTELANEHYLVPLREWAHQHGTQARSQNYGIPPVVLSSNALVDLAEGEGAQWRKFSATRWASSANHLMGRPVTSSETLTWLHSPAFRATPLDMKAEADLHFLQGINQLIGHGWPYSPESAGEPGWCFYAAAVFNAHNPWWPVLPDVSRYLQRVSFLLRQGKPSNDVAIYLPTDDAWARFTPGHVSVDEMMDSLLGPDLIPQILDAGYNFDFIDDGLIEQAGIPTRILVLPGVERIPLATLEKLEAFERAGGFLLATRRMPSLAPGLLEAERETPRIRELAHRLFEAPGSPRTTTVRGSLGHFVRDERQELSSTLVALLPPDLSTSPKTPDIGFVHRKLDFADVYFIANTSNQVRSVRATFRVAGLEPEWWDPSSGEVSPAEVTARAKDGITVAVNLEEYGSRMLVFSGRRAPAIENPAAARAAARAIDLSPDWKVTYDGLGRTLTMHRLHSWTEDDETRFYCGQAAYEKTAAVPETFFEPGRRAYLSLGQGAPVPPGPGHGTRAWLESPVREAALVYVNGRLAGSVWHPPYQLDVTNVLHAGENEIRIRVGNLAINCLAGQASPDYRLLNSRYGARFTPQDMENLAPLPAGLLGPVRLISRLKD